MAVDERAREILQVKNICNALILLSGHLRIYSDSNRMVELTSARLKLLLDEYFSAHASLQIGVARHGFLYAGEFLERSNKQYERFAGQLFMHGLASLTVTSAVVPAELHDLLRIVNRKPSETWDEGGVISSLAARQVVHVIATELSDRVLQLSDDAAGGGDESSVLWDRFALAQQAQFGDDAEAVAPEALAQRCNAAAANGGEAERNRLVHLASEFLLSLQHENVRIYRTQALAKLTAFIGQLTPELRRHFLQNSFNLKLSGDFAEGFYSGLSDELIMDALHDAALGGRYVPPVILSLLGKLARERGLTEEAATSPAADPGDGLDRKTRELFRVDAFEEYVPATYRQALLAVVRSGRLEGATELRVEELKRTLQAEAVEQHLGVILLEILREDPEAQHLQGLRNGLEKVLQGYLDLRDYPGLRQLLHACEGVGSGHALASMFHSAGFAHSLLRTLPKAGKEQYEELRTLMIEVGSDFIAPLLDYLALENNRTLRHFCIETLRGLGRSVSGEAASRLKDRRWYVQRNLLYLLRELDDAEALPKIRPFVRHEHPKVREEALKACLHFRDPTAEPVLLEELTARERDRVLSALSIARLAHSERITTVLIELLQRGTLFGYDLEMKRKLVQCLAFCGREQALPVLQQQLESRSLLHGEQHEQLKLEIVKALGYFPPEKTRPLLTRLVGNGSAEIKRLAQGLLERGGRGAA